MSAILRAAIGRPFEFLDLHTLRNCVGPAGTRMAGQLHQRSRTSSRCFRRLLQLPRPEHLAARSVLRLNKAIITRGLRDTSRVHVSPRARVKPDRILVTARASKRENFHHAPQRPSAVPFDYHRIRVSASRWRIINFSATRSSSFQPGARNRSERGKMTYARPLSSRDKCPRERGEVTDVLVLLIPDTWDFIASLPTELC